MPSGKENMELKHLLSYATVVRLGSFSRAAEELYIAQPTISQHIRQLEEELQTKLLIRTTKSIELTEKGREVYECAVSILQLKDRICEKCSDGEKRIICEFAGAEGYTERGFELDGISGRQRVTLAFLPGSCFDLSSIRFEY